MPWVATAKPESSISLMHLYLQWRAAPKLLITSGDVATISPREHCDESPRLERRNPYPAILVCPRSSTLYE